MKAYVIVAAALLLTGCVPSLEPLYTDRDVTSDPRVAGAWTVKGGDMTVTADGRGYKIAYTDNESPVHRMNFKAHLVKLGGSLFVDLFPEPPKDMSCYPCVPMHMFAKLAIQGNTLRADLMDPEWFGKMAKQGKIPAAHTLIDDAYVLTAKTADLQALMLKYQGDPAAFLKSDAWTRKP